MSATHETFVSVIVPAYNDQEGIRNTLESITEQTYPDEFYEVLAIDNNSTDGTRSVIREFSQQYPETVDLLVEDQRQGPPAARNKGLEHASGSIIAFIDADMTVEKTWLESVTDSMQRNEWKYMGCNVEITLEENRKTLTAIYNSIFGFQMDKYIQEAHFTGTGCLVVRQSVFDAVGPFDDELITSGDREFGDRVYRAGFDQHFQPNITMYHPARASLQDMLAKAFRDGRGQTHVAQYDPDRFGNRNICHPRNYLPLHPTYFYEKVNQEADLEIQEMMVIYLIAYLSKLSVAAGRIYQRLTDGGEFY